MRTCAHGAPQVEGGGRWPRKADRLLGMTLHEVLEMASMSGERQDELADLREQVRLERPPPQGGGQAEQNSDGEDARGSQSRGCIGNEAPEEEQDHDIAVKFMPAPPTKKRRTAPTPAGGGGNKAVPPLPAPGASASSGGGGCPGPAAPVPEGSRSCNSPVLRARS